MAEKMKVKVAGVVENMSYIKCGNCGENIRVFSKKSAEEQAAYLGTPLLAELPMDLELVESLEKGEAESFVAGSQFYKSAFKSMVEL